ncbi:PREDICTED: ester hydrolase C11orf54 homolog [Nicrophorus vespilloides]|uniref:Ester hydrolase C11orf54 homolog n=1 Tax=Nicrophorus vespilloides TaxID=110193 RepID=A0ABM1MB20_NICVS|nr:PREDICTED: ester hydrolase C11orf54 homolog [Nicrophorus vespilloides]XP_017771770.1 PREDICTED: ester hydrolase C11orf54 homolog [Nicrophorus vespilloides]XP_017771771.1 PREDICTED: ester hydrolase C11orf54 homolog [Nicrophorus vespilloides]
MALCKKDYPVVKKPFHVPELRAVADVLNNGLKAHFSEVLVEVVDCPDLTQAPFHLANKGLNGNPNLLDIGGPSFLIPLVDRTKVYDLKDMAEISGNKPAFLIGAGAGPFNHLKTNCEGIFNINVGDEIKQESRIGMLNRETGSPMELKLNNSITEFGLLGNLYSSQGKEGKVLKVHAVKRIGTIDFIASIRSVLSEAYKSQDGIVGLGGTFIIKKGSAKLHIMPDFSDTPIEDDETLNKWLQFFNMSSPLVAVGTLVTGTYNMDLREQHFHMFSDHGNAGHYHIDTTPDVVEYLGYFNVANHIFRVDQPKTDAAFGKD